MASLAADHRISSPVLRASWLNVAFLHWRAVPETVQALLPKGLTVDVHEGSAWLSLVPHVMADMRPLGLPLLPDLTAVPGGFLPDLSSTPETNLRTYVRGPDGRDGLWFFSLDVPSAGLAAALRAFVGAPYFAGRLSIERTDHTVQYAGSRVGGNERYEVKVRPGGLLDEVSPLAVWLTGRWRAYSRHVGRLLVTPVAHEPWPLRSATVDGFTENLAASAHLPAMEAPLVHFSEGVTTVRVGVPRVLP
jgi:uncharacterized protein YqjF (DUF2071 family)